ncbi:MAG: hypothetical protein IJU36_03845 [Paludibacteraceae bacterium]|nr:hypothetical protein [Paludibacteraceae bacterium]
MTNYHFISIFIISCILLGIQSSVSAQSSDWVYSPYAQYLTNDTTISPPVGEPADAALSCFRHDTIYVLVMPSGEFSIGDPDTALPRWGEEGQGGASNRFAVSLRRLCDDEASPRPADG